MYIPPQTLQNNHTIKTTKQIANNFTIGSKHHTPILTLNVYGINTPLKRHTVARQVFKKTYFSAVFKRLVSYIMAPIGSTKCVGERSTTRMENKKEQGHNSYVTQNKLQSNSKKGQRRALHNDKSFHSIRRFNYTKYIQTQHRSIQIHKTNSLPTKRL